MSCLSPPILVCALSFAANEPTTSICGNIEDRPKRELAFFSTGILCVEAKRFLSARHSYLIGLGVEPLTFLPTCDDQRAALDSVSALWSWVNAGSIASQEVVHCDQGDQTATACSVRKGPRRGSRGDAWSPTPCWSKESCYERRWFRWIPRARSAWVSNPAGTRRLADRRRLVVRTRRGRKIQFVPKDRAELGRLAGDRQFSLNNPPYSVSTRS